MAIGTAVSTIVLSARRRVSDTSAPSASGRSRTRIAPYRLITAHFQAEPPGSAPGITILLQPTGSTVEKPL